MSSRVKRNRVEFYPATDAQAIEIIEKTGNYHWETHKVSGRFVHDPYALAAKVDGQTIRIYLPGRRGTVLTWLRHKLDAAEAAAVTGVAQ